MTHPRKVVAVDPLCDRLKRRPQLPVVSYVRDGNGRADRDTGAAERMQAAAAGVHEVRRGMFAGAASEPTLVTACRAGARLTAARRARGRPRSARRSTASADRSSFVQTESRTTSKHASSKGLACDTASTLPEGTRHAHPGNNE